jgi:tetratricopeptide (TPR) repeat protein
MKRNIFVDAKFNSIIFLLVSIFLLSAISFGQKNKPKTAPTEKPETFYQLGLECPEINYDCKIYYFTKAIQLNPKYVDAYLKRGNSYYDKKLINESLLDYKKVIELKTDSAEAYAQRGRICQIRNNTEKALEYFTKSIEINPNNPDTLYDRGGIYCCHLKNFASALADYKKSVQVDADFILGYIGIGLELRNTDKTGNFGIGLNEFNIAIETATKKIGKNPKDSESYYLRGFTSSLFKDYDKAIEDLSKANELDLNNAVIIYQLARQFYKTEKYSQAIEMYSRVIELDGNYKNAFEDRAKCFDALGEYDKAKDDRKKLEEISVKQDC